VPRLIPAETDAPIELGDLVEMLEAGPFDPDDEDCMASWGPALKKLANNRRFLGDLVVAELKQRCAGQLARNQYSAQVILLHNRSGKFLIRANFWPAEGDSVVVQSGAAPFFYGVPHDHNFSFLTAGYLGPGYRSDNFEYDYGSVAGHVGEKVDLRFVGRSGLEQGKVMLYRAHRDIHLQLPADAMSVSLNILGNSPTHEFRDQYRFDVERSEIAGILNSVSLEPLVALAAHFGGEGAELVDRYAARHPSDRIRFAAVSAKAAAADGLDGRIEVFEQAARAPSRFVSAMAKREAERLEKGRTWIESPPGRLPFF
jgi:hypothetical protein